MRMIGYKTQTFCGKHCCHSMLIGKRNRRMAKHTRSREKKSDSGAVKFDLQRSYSSVGRASDF